MVVKLESNIILMIYVSILIRFRFVEKDLWLNLLMPPLLLKNKKARKVLLGNLPTQTFLAFLNYIKLYFKS